MTEYWIGLRLGLGQELGLKLIQCLDITEHLRNDLFDYVENEDEMSDADICHHSCGRMEMCMPDQTRMYLYFVRSYEIETISVRIDES